MVLSLKNDAKKKKVFSAPPMNPMSPEQYTCFYSTVSIDKIRTRNSDYFNYARFPAKKKLSTTEMWDNCKGSTVTEGKTCEQERERNKTTQHTAKHRTLMILPAA